MFVWVTFPLFKVWVNYFLNVGTQASVLLNGGSTELNFHRKLRHVIGLFSFLCECVQYLKLVNLDVYKYIEKFWTDKVYCQFVIVMLVRAGMNLTFKIVWKFIINKKKYLDSQVNALVQNTRTKEKQMEKLQMPAKEQIGMEVRNVALPIAFSC